MTAFTAGDRDAAVNASSPPRDQPRKTTRPLVGLTRARSHSTPPMTYSIGSKLIFGGRPSARSIHFLCAFALLGFFVVHIAMVVLAGPFNELRSMLTGWYRLPHDKGTK